MKPTSLLIIGGTGFFGKSILKYLLNNTFLKIKKIFILSRRKLELETYNKKLRKKFKIIKINSNILTIKNLPKVDYVIYAAILKSYKNDHKAVKNYINLAKKYHLNSKILYISSGAVYGEQPESIKGFKENYFKYHKKINFKKGYKQSYANFKLSSEKLFQKLGNEGFKVSIARCFAFVGEFLPLNSNFVIGNLIQSILDGVSIKINANYKIFRSYMYADDLARWLLKILDNSNPQCPIYNVGSNDKISIHQVANTLAKKFNKRINFARLSSKKSDSYVPNINKAKKILDLRIHNSSVEGIFKTINILIKKNCRV
jgi:dTDP-glucose 4,6-dehydratase